MDIPAFAMAYTNGRKVLFTLSQNISFSRHTCHVLRILVNTLKGFHPLRSEISSFIVKGDIPIRIHRFPVASGSGHRRRWENNFGKGERNGRKGANGSDPVPDIQAQG
jgi:hypothetical protein